MDWSKFNKCAQYVQPLSYFFQTSKRVYFQAKQIINKPLALLKNPAEALPRMSAFQLVGLEFNQEQQQYIVILKKRDQTHCEKRSASSVSRDTLLVQQLSSEDANRVGYMAGFNDALLHVQRH